MSTACLQPSRNLMLLRYCLSSNERRTGLRKIGMKKTSPMRLLEWTEFGGYVPWRWTGMDAEISDIWNFRRRAKINVKQQQQMIVYRDSVLYQCQNLSKSNNTWISIDWRLFSFSNLSILHAHSRTSYVQCVIHALQCVIHAQNSWCTHKNCKYGYGVHTRKEKPSVICLSTRCCCHLPVVRNSLNPVTIACLLSKSSQSDS
jgi:hypothetical protein